MVVLIVVILLLLFGPQLWASYILRRYSTPRHDFAGNGSEFAQHLLDKLKLPYVKVEQSEQGDHYDPVACAVRLGPDNMKQPSLTALVVAAHEVGHAVQHAVSYSPFGWRNSLVRAAQKAEKLGSMMMLAIPLAGLVTRSPTVSAIIMALGLLSLFSVVLVHLVTLPVEWDASFRRALPILKNGEYLNAKDLKIARRILLACALTYVAQSLMGLLNLWRWLRVLRR